MIELTVLALLNRLMNWGRDPVIATRVIAADAAVLHSLVSDPATQPGIVAGISPRLRPAAGVASRASARIVGGCAQLAGRDVLWLTWILTPRRGTTEVDLAAQLESRSVIARLALLLGGRRWLQHRLDAILATVAALAHGAAENADARTGQRPLHRRTASCSQPPQRRQATIVKHRGIHG